MKLKTKIYYIATDIWDRVPFLRPLMDIIRDWAFNDDLYYDL